MIEPAFLPATELLTALRERRISSRELLEHQLQRIERYNRSLHALLSLDAERAMAEAQVADEARARGRDLGPLHGLPVAVTEEIEEDSDAMVRLRAAGAIVIGGTSGSAAAVAAGLTNLELGVDLAGSVRRAAHRCGAYGLKPSWGAVPGHDADMSAIGPLARGVDDLELALDVLAGPADDDAIAWSLELPAPRADWLGDYRVAVWLDDPAAPVDRAVLAALRATIDKVADAGLEIVERRPPVPVAEARRVHHALLMGVYCSGMAEGAFAALKHLAATTPQSHDEDEAMRRARLLTQTKRDWSAADEERRAMRHRWAELFLEFDAFLCPVAAYDPDDVVWTDYASAAYLPAVSLPVGLQVIGPYLEDRTALDVARRVSEVAGGFEAPAAFSAPATVRA
jgi:amidase